MWLQIVSGPMTLDKHLQLLRALDGTVETSPSFKVNPFEFNVLDTPNRDIAMATVQAGLAGELLNEGMYRGDLAKLTLAKSYLEKAVQEFPDDTDPRYTPPILKNNWHKVIDMLELLSAWESLPRPPKVVALTPQQAKNITELAKQIWAASMDVPNEPWRKGIQAWLKRHTYRNAAYQMKSALDREGVNIDCKAMAKRMHEILMLMECGKWTDDAIYADIKGRFTAGYQIELGRYTAILPKTIESGAFFQ